MGKRWNRSAVSLTAVALAMAGSVFGGGAAIADEIPAYTVGTRTTLADNSGTPYKTIPSSLAGTVSISTSKGAGGTFINLSVRNRQVMKEECYVTGVSNAVGYTRPATGFNKKFSLNSSGSANVTVGPVQDGVAFYTTGCRGFWEGREVVGQLINPDSLDIKIGNQATGTVPPPATSQPSQPPSGQPGTSAPRKGQPTYKDCAPLFADPLTDGQLFSDPVTGGLSAAVKVVCAQVAYFNGDEKLQLELICEGFVGASTSLIPGPKVKGQTLDASPDVIGAIGRLGDLWPDFARAINDAKCTGRSDYPQFKGKGGGGW